MGPLTYADYAAMPDDGRRYELIDGELIMTPAPGTGHQWVVACLFDRLRAHVRERDIGVVLDSPLDVILSEKNTIQPDLVYVDRARCNLLRKRGIDRLKLDVLKVSHHASQNNLSKDLLALLDCRRYCISTNGDYFCHPDREAVGRIVKYGGDRLSNVRRAFRLSRRKLLGQLRDQPCRYPQRL